MLKAKIAFQILKYYFRQIRGREAILRYQEKQFRKLLYHAFDKSPFYQKLYTAHGIKRSDLTTISYNQLPIINKELLRNNIDEVFTDRHLHLKRIEKWMSNHPDPEDMYYKKFFVVHTSGSSAGMFYNVYNINDMIYTIACFITRIFPPTFKRVSIVFYGAIEGHYTGVTLAKLGNLIGYHTEVISVHEPIETVVDKLNTLQPDRILAYGSAYTELIRQATINKLKINPKYLGFSGDGITKETVKQIQKIWDTNLINNYISTETLVIGFNSKGGSDFTVFDDHIKLQIYNKNSKKICNNGEKGNVLVTNLHNFTTPIIRYFMDDIGTILPTKKPSPFSTLKLNKARVINSPIIINEDGKESIIHGTTLVDFFVEGVTSYQFNFISKNKVIIKYLAKNVMDEKIKKAFEDILKKRRATKDYIIEPEKVERILPEKNGKTPLVKISY